jgi:DnaJ-class molecular chaperone
MPELIVEEKVKPAPAEYVFYRICQRCHGTGVITVGIDITASCPGCGGDGEIQSGRMVKVDEE